MGTTPKTGTPWYETMVALTGIEEVPGVGDNDTILSWPRYIAKQYPEMSQYCAQYNHDEIPWCGLTVAICMALNGIRPQYGDTDVKRFLWADSWKYFGKESEAKKGAIMVFTRNGGGHVSLYEGEEPGYYLIRGGNQSDMVNVTRMSKSKLTAIRWPS